jgi:GntR family transcriptional regulator
VWHHCRQLADEGEPEAGARVAESMYWQIAQDLRQQIESGALPPGEKLPTEQQLSEKYVASRNTIRDAIKWLTSRTLVETRPGQGTFVARRPTPFVTTLSADQETGLGGGEGKAALAEAVQRGRRARASEPRVEIQSASGNVQARLQVPEGSQVVSRHQERYIDDTPWSLQTTFYPMDLVLRGAIKLLAPQDIPSGTVAYLQETLGLVQVGYRDRILVRSPHDHESRFFGLPDDGRISVVLLMRTGYQASGQGPVPFRVTFTVLPADRNQLVINFGQVPGALAAPAVV